MAEVPWFDRAPSARLVWLGGWDEIGVLTFTGPDGHFARIPVSEKPTHDGPAGPVWHVEVVGLVATVSPSIHFVDAWHSPNLVVFMLTDDE